MRDYKLLQKKRKKYNPTSKRAALENTCIVNFIQKKLSKKSYPQIGDVKIITQTNFTQTNLYPKFTRLIMTK